MNFRISVAHLAFALLLGTAFGLRAQALPDPPAKSITDFVNCVNDTLTKLNQNGSVTIADTVSCLPPKCSVIVTKSMRSDQPACRLYNSTAMVHVQFPRLIFSCPGSKADLQLRPSYSLCPERGQHKKLELAEDVRDSSMILANVPIEGADMKPTIDKGKFMKIVDNQVKNQPTGKLDGKGVDAGTQGCNVCHFPLGANAKDGNFLLSMPIDPLSAKAVWRQEPNGFDLKSDVLFSNQGDLTKSPDLGKYCRAIKDNKKGLEASPFGPSSADLDVIIALCENLAKYKP